MLERTCALVRVLRAAVAAGEWDVVEGLLRGPRGADPGSPPAARGRRDTYGAESPLALTRQHRVLSSLSVTRERVGTAASIDAEASAARDAEPSAASFAADGAGGVRLAWGEIADVARPEVRLIEGEGMPKHGVPSEFGQLVVEFRVNFPKALGEAQRESVLKW